MVERTPGDPRELLRIWMQWEEGQTTPGKVMSDLKAHGMRELLEGLAEQIEAGGSGPEAAGGT